MPSADGAVQHFCFCAIETPASGQIDCQREIRAFWWISGNILPAMANRLLLSITAGTSSKPDSKFRATTILETVIFWTQRVVPAAGSDERSPQQVIYGLLFAARLQWSRTDAETQARQFWGEWRLQRGVTDTKADRSTSNYVNAAQNAQFSASLANCSQLAGVPSLPVAVLWVYMVRGAA